MNHSADPAREETIYYLEMLSPAELRPAQLPLTDWDLRRAEIPCPELSRFFYTAVGGDWLWVDRLEWDYGKWLEWVARPGYEMWVAYVRGTPAGYFELDAQPNGETELGFFGLMPQFAGLRLGGAMLTRAIERAWAIPSRKVWLHTCSFDHPVALKNYLARGFHLARTERSLKPMPAAPLGPWPGAAKTTQQAETAAQLSGLPLKAGEHRPLASCAETALTGSPPSRTSAC
jgi:GNAT superfamily N-acetyltransferase